MSKVTPVVVDADGNFRAKNEGDTVDVGVDLSTKVDKGVSKNAGEAIGLESNATQSKALAVGAGSSAEGQKAVAVGGASAIGGSSIAIGTAAMAKGAASIVIGEQADSQSYNNVVVGTSAKAADVSSVAVGHQAVAGGKSSVAIGQGATTTEQGTATFGSSSNRRRIVHVDDGKDDYDAVNMKQLRENSGGGGSENPYIKTEASTENPAGAVGGGDGTIVIGSGAGNGAMDAANKATVVGSLSKSLSDQGSVFGYNCSATGVSATVVGCEATAQGDNTVSIGYQTAASQRGAISVGWGAKALADDSIVLGRNAKSSGNGAIVAGVGANTTAQQTIVLGSNAQATGNNGIAVGQSTKSVFNSMALGSLAEATGGNATLVGYGTKASQGSTALGQSAQATGESSVVVGTGASATSANSMALGDGATATHAGSIAIGSGSTTSGDDVVSIGSLAKRRKLTNVANGEDPFDGVNMQQLQAFGLQRKVTSGNFSWNYSDSKTAANAAGKVGNSCYLKNTITLSGMPRGNANIIPSVQLEKVPCREDGTVIPYTLYVKSVTANNNTEPKFTMTIVMQEVPTHLLDVSSLEVKPAARNDNGLSVGIPEIPITDDVFSVNEVRYIASYYVLGS